MTISKKYQPFKLSSLTRGLFKITTLALCLLLSTTNTRNGVFVVDAAAAMCDGLCVTNLTESCSRLLETMEFGGTCCSLFDDAETGGCQVRHSGSCYWKDPCVTGCTPRCQSDPNEVLSCLVPYTLFSSTSNETCPVSSYEALNRDQPKCLNDPCAVSTTATGSDNTTATNKTSIDEVQEDVEMTTNTIATNETNVDEEVAQEEDEKEEDEKEEEEKEDDTSTSGGESSSKRILFSLMFTIFPIFYNVLSY